MKMARNCKERGNDVPVLYACQEEGETKRKVHSLVLVDSFDCTFIDSRKREENSHTQTRRHTHRHTDMKLYAERGSWSETCASLGNT